jgi:DNA invertase Pin-like site-specific DNA recombinase
MTSAKRSSSSPSVIAAQPALVSSKILPHHRDRVAIVYIRQSSPRQVIENRESTDRQYQLADRAVALGWPADRVQVIDGDLGQSGRSATHRLGFQRLLAEVGLNHVGLVLGLEMSRLARSCKDWHQLLELCGLFRTLLADADGVYDPADPNDRLLLGLKGTMSEAELHVMRSRLLQGKRNKAARGELFVRLPPGYILDSDSKPAFDPDEQVRGTIAMVFDLFARLGSGRAVAWHMQKQGIKLPLRPNNGPRPRPLIWRTATESAVGNLLRNPTFAGAYVYGRVPEDSRRSSSGRPSRTELPIDQWPILLRDRIPAYITWEQYLANRERLRQNASRWNTPGVPRKGAAVLPGLVYCDRCGYRMSVHYPGAGRWVYQCMPRTSSRTRGSCAAVRAEPLDALIGELVLKALEPAALELSLQAHQRIERDRAGQHTEWRQRIERARFQADRAKRQYDAVEPENRLVARTLERQWEEALAEVRRTEEEYARFQTTQPRALSATDRAAIRQLATDLPRLWVDPTTTAKDRQAVIRLLVESVRVLASKRSEWVEASVRWVGGHVTQHRIRRPIRETQQLEGFEDLKKQLAAWRPTGMTAAEMAQRLNAAGIRPPKGPAFTTGGVRVLLYRLGLNVPRARIREECGKDEYPLSVLAMKLGVSRSGIGGWLSRGWLHARRQNGHWIAWADADELARLTRLRDEQRLPFPSELTTPKTRPERIRPGKKRTGRSR